MFRPAKNPVVAELTKSYRGRLFALGDLKAIKLEDGSRQCVWCLDKLIGKQLKWCSGECAPHALAWARPQSEYGLHVLLVRQNFACNDCGYDYTSYVNAALAYLNKYRKTVDPSKIKEEIYPLLMQILKRKTPRDRLPEVDHVIPISKGGTAIGLENHQAICYTCHKKKTKVDNSGPRKKK